MFFDANVILYTLRAPILHLHILIYFMFYVVITLHDSCQSKDIIELLEHLLALLYWNAVWRLKQLDISHDHYQLL